MKLMEKLIALMRKAIDIANIVADSYDNDISDVRDAIRNEWEGERRDELYADLERFLRRQRKEESKRTALLVLAVGFIAVVADIVTIVAVFADPSNVIGNTFDKVMEIFR